MNKNRRKRISDVIYTLKQVKDVLNIVMNEEDDAFNNLSEGLQCTMRGEQMEENISELEEAIEHIEEALDNLDIIE